MALSDVQLLDFLSRMPFIDTPSDVSLRGVVILACKPGAFFQRLLPAHATGWEVADKQQFRQLPLYLV